MTLYRPPENSRKGDNGRLLVIGGSKDYHGAPIFSLLAARRFVDLLYFMPAEKDAHLVGAVKHIPEVIVISGPKSGAVRGLDCVLFGIGMSGAKFDISKLKALKAKLVIDGDGLKRAKGRIPKGAILTPHENEFRMLFSMDGTEKNVKAMAKKTGCVILKKGRPDIISDGSKVVKNSIHNQGMTKGGTGDVLAGLVAALACKNDNFTAACAGALISGHAGNMLLEKFGYNYSASDLADMLAEAYRNMGMDE
ncbi:MAG TPA: NAD(P)H-hydrate dehydratase [Candidatus Bilamarchaeum sp.]|nr:NAD(P)H-hydrate dehydratase [Candidatus Bilamarchaeum sp.]